MNRLEELDAAFTADPEIPPLEVLRRFAARGHFAGEELPVALKDAAREANAGLCFQCHRHVPSAIPPLPKPAILSHGRLRHDGTVVEVIESFRGRRVVMAFPNDRGPAAEITALRYSPRFRATVVAAAVIAVFGFATLASRAHWFAFVGVGAGWACYLIVRCLHREWPSADRVALDAAWRVLVPRLTGFAESTDTLIRICRASIGRGDVAERAEPLRNLVESLAVLAELSVPERQLLAVARLMQVFDGTELGVEKVASLAVIFEPFIAGQAPPVYAEAAAQTLLECGTIADGDLRRLRIALIAASFAARFSPADLIRLVHPLRALRALMEPLETDALEQVYAVRRGLPPNRLEQAGGATSVFELANTSPTLSRKLLMRRPDALLRIVLPEALRKGIGEVVLTPRGLFVDDMLIEESDATIEIERSPTGSGWHLAVGSHRISVDHKPPLQIAEALAAWLDYRRSILIPAARKAPRPDPFKVARMVAPLVVPCPACGTANVVRVGEVGERYDLP